MQGIPRPYIFLAGALAFGLSSSASARPAHKQALADYFGPFLTKKLNDCRTCHLPDRPGQSGDDRPHNPFGARLKAVKDELRKAGKKIDIASRLDAIAEEDCDGDGVSNLLEILSGHNPGDPDDKPTEEEIALAKKKLAAFLKYRSGYPWRPFAMVQRPSVPTVKNATWVRNPIDAFLAAEQEERGLKPRPEAPRPVLLRRVYLDLIGLPPTPEELHAFQQDNSADAYEKVVDRLLASPRYGERWGRHWMDVWRYSDVDGTGNQIYSQPHIWRWRDWIIEALNEDKGYDRMVQEMLAADELTPEDPQALRATGFLVRNYNQFYPHVWLQDTVEYTSQALLGVTLRCARCHDHMYDPILQKEYYQVQAIFAPQQVRIDHVPNQFDTKKDGLVRLLDGNPKAETFFLVRGDLQKPDKSAPVQPGVPAALGGRLPDVTPVTLPQAAYAPENRAFVVEMTIAASEAETRMTHTVLIKQAAAAAASHALGSCLAIAKTADNLDLAQVDAALAEARHTALLATLAVERLEGAGKKDAEEWKTAASAAVVAQRKQALCQARKNVLVAQQAKRAAVANAQAAAAKAVTDAEKALAKAEADVQAPADTKYTPRPIKTYPQTSTGRRLAFARWIADRENPLAARVAMNHIWLRHFGQPLAPRMYDLGRNGGLPTHPALLDWLAVEFMEPSLSTQGKPWTMKRMHRLLVTSSAYRMASTPDADNLAKDVDNHYYWRMPYRRIEAEVLRDSIFAMAGKLDLTMGGPDIDQRQGLTVPRRSIYFRHAEDKQVEFLKIFDGASAIECYQRTESIVPQQALAMANSELTATHARAVAQMLLAKLGADPGGLAKAAFERILCRPPTAQEEAVCTTFLRDKFGERKADDPAVARACESLVRSLMNHYEFRTAR
jgi:hypothetical protein